MSDWEIWGTIIELTLATVTTRSSFWLIGDRIPIPRRIHEMLRYAPACALAAIIAPDLLLSGAQIELQLSNLKLVSGIVAIGFFLISRSMLQTIVFGMLFFTALRLLHVF
jgi:branched-subunit amino acid transport protein